MVLRSPSTPSEGEIVESDSEKATTSLRLTNGTNVDRQSRTRVSVSRSPSPYRSPRRRPSRTPSRSPYRETRGSKRLREDDHYNDRPRNGARRSRARHEDRLLVYGTASRSSYDDLDRSREPNPNLRYDDRGPHGRSRDWKSRTRSRSPFRSKPAPPDQDRYDRDAKGGRTKPQSWIVQGGKGYGESISKLSREQSVSGRSQPSIAIAATKRDAENRINQGQQSINLPKPSNNNSAIGFQGERESALDLQESTRLNDLHIIDESTLIEERRKKREAIKARHRDSAPKSPVLSQCPNHESETEAIASQSKISVPPPKSPFLPPDDITGQDSPTELVVLRDTDLTPSNASGVLHGDEPSAADYDPTLDMQEDQLRNDQRQRGDEILAANHDENCDVKQDILLPQKSMNTSVEKESEREFDMFAEGDELDTTEQVPVAPEPDGLERAIAKPLPIPQAKALDMSMLDDWDDQEGYYKVILGELLDGRYHVQSNLGKGMFSGVVRATDQRSTRLVAIKIIRNNETMKKAGLKEIKILQKLSQYDPEDKKHVIRLERYFEHKGHLCMVFENLSINLREVLKKFGRDVGINLKAVRAYAQQMFMGLTLLRKCNILHADLKPDNVLVNESRNLLKICDLGSASDASENEITPYLVSRFYRAPEIILGMPYDFGIDTWSIGCTLFELYTGKILFTGRSNNQMLRAIMECRGKFGHKILRKAPFAGLHFDDLLNFRSVEKDRLSGKDVIRILNFTKPTRDLKTRVLANAKGTMDEVEKKELNLFVDLLDRCLNLNPEKRCLPAEALRHPFITRAKV